MNDELRELIEHLEKVGLQNQIDPSWPDEKEEAAKYTRRYAEFCASQIMKGRRLKEKEDRFRQAMGIRLKTPKNGET